MKTWNIYKDGYHSGGRTAEEGASKIGIRACGIQPTVVREGQSILVCRTVRPLLLSLIL